MSLRSLITKYGASYNVTRLAAGSYDAAGSWIPGGPTVIPIVAYIEPVEGAELEDIPEGQRRNEMRRVFTETALIAGPQPDTIAIGSEAWTVIRAPRWAGLGGAHDVAIIARNVTP